MNAEVLLKHFERISDAPDAIPRLRQFVLDLAVRGKLLEQDPNDEPASLLLKRIQTERAKRVLDGEMKDSRLEPVGYAEKWFDISAGWCWVRLGEITQVLMGQSPPGDTYNKSAVGIPLINGPVEFTEGPFGKTVVNQYTTAPTNVCEEGDLLLCVRGSTTGRTNIAASRACIGRGVAAIRPFFADRYVRLYVWRLRASILAMGRGIAFPSISRQQIIDLPVPLPPLAEQHRIVAKVDELMALCDRLEEAQKEREARRDRLTAASHHQLSNSADGDELREHARFFINHLPRLTALPNQIRKLHQTILNLAVRGRVVPQNAKDELAAGLMQRLQAEKTRLEQKGDLKKSKPLPPIYDLDVPFKLPHSWLWKRWGEIARKIGDIDHKMPETVSDGGVPYISPRDFLPRGRIDFDGAKRVSRDDYERLALKMKPSTGDLIYPRYGTIGENRLVDTQRDFLVSYSCAVIKVMDGFLHPKFQYVFSMSDCCRNQAKAAENKTTQANVGIQSIQEFLFPLPPLAEQYRIVAKVDELMAICDGLKTQLTTIRTDSSDLLQAVLHEALAPS